MKINAAWSGGYDSTYMIIKFLEQGYTVKPYYYILKERIDSDNAYSVNGVKTEINAVKNISKILKIKYKNNLEDIEFIDFSNNDGDQYQAIAKHAEKIQENIVMANIIEDFNMNPYRILSKITNNEVKVPIWKISPFKKRMGLITENIPTARAHLDIKTVNCRINPEYFKNILEGKWLRNPIFHICKHLLLLEMYEDYNDIFSHCITCRYSINGISCGNCKNCSEWDQYKLEESLTLKRARKLRNYLKENNISPDIIHEIPINKSLKLPEHITAPLDSYIDGRSNVKELRKRLNLK